MDKVEVLPLRPNPMYCQKKRVPFARAWPRVNIQGIELDVCWTWHAANSNGRGQVRLGSGHNRSAGRLIHIDRLVYSTVVFPIPIWRTGHYQKGAHLVYRVCRNPLCCRPSHLRYGPKPKIPKVRIPRKPSPPMPGEMSPNSKLTDSFVLQLRKLRAQGYSTERILRERNYLLRGIPHVVDTTIRNAITGRTFRYLPIPDYPKIKPLALTSSGRKNPRAKLNGEKVRVIKKVMAFCPRLRKHNYKIVAGRLGLKPNTVANICKGTNWKRVRD